MTISTPKNPTGDDYEDFMAAYFMALGYFTEGRVRLNESGTEVLELDLVCSPSDLTDGTRLLVDAKSGGWGFSDLFKIYGWRTFLGIPAGHIIYAKKQDDQKLVPIQSVGETVNVLPFQLNPDEPNFSLIRSANSLSSDLMESVASSNWYFQIAHRLMFQTFRHSCKSNKDIKVFEAAYDYQFQTEESFFSKTGRARVEKLYEAFTKNARIAGSIVKHLASTKKTDEKDIWKAASNSAEHSSLQYVMHLEHRARIAVIKNALDFSREISASETKTKSWLSTSSLPATFSSALRKLREYEFASRVPYLLQIFIDLFGGFILEEIKSKEHELLAKIAGIPAKEVPTCLQFYDEFFPMEKGWYFSGKKILQLKMVPSYVRGSGCFFRHSHYAIKSYFEISKEGDWLLGAWHNTLYGVLKPKLGIAEEVNP